MDDLLLLSGNDIPFIPAQVNIHQPTIKEIAYIGEENFFLGSELLNFTKDSLSEEDKINLEGQTNFDIIMSMIIDKATLQSQISALGATMVLTIIFPNYTVYFKQNPKQILLVENNESKKEHILDSRNFSQFQEILRAMLFGIYGGKGDSYNPQGDLAKKIADKLKAGQRKRAESKGQQKISILSRYISILAVGEHKDINNLMQYTVYQLLDEFQRFELKLTYDQWIQARLAGAKDQKEVTSWFEDIHDENFKKDK